MCENMLEEERVKKETERTERERKTVIKSKHGFKCQTQIEDNILIEMEGIISNVPLIHEAGVCSIIADKTN